MLRRERRVIWFIVMLEIELREELAKLLSKEIPLESFEEWFVQRSWNMHKNSDSYAQRLASAIELRLAEYDNGDLPEEDLHRELAQLAHSTVQS